MVKRRSLASPSPEAASSWMPPAFSAQMRKSVGTDLSCLAFPLGFVIFRFLLLRQSVSHRQA